MSDLFSPLTAAFEARMAQAGAVRVVRPDGVHWRLPGQHGEIGPEVYQDEAERWLLRVERKEGE